MDGQINTLLNTSKTVFYVEGVGYESSLHRIKNGNYCCYILHVTNCECMENAWSHKKATLITMHSYDFQTNFVQPKKWLSFWMLN